MVAAENEQVLRLEAVLEALDKDCDFSACFLWPVDVIASVGSEEEEGLVTLEEVRGLVGDWEEADESVAILNETELESEDSL